MIANRKPYRRLRVRRAGNEINGSLRAKSPPRRLPEDTSTPLRSVTIPALSVRLAIDRSPFSYPRIKTHEPTSAVRAARWHVSRVNLSPRYIRRLSRVPSLSEKSATFVISIRACAVYCRAPSRRADTQIAILRFTCTRSLFISLGFYIR